MKPTTYPEMNAKIKDILRTGNQASQYAAQRIEELEDEVSRYRTEAANERELSEDIVAERETLIIENERQQERIEQLETTMKEIKNSLYGVGNIVNIAIGYEENLDYTLLSNELERLYNVADNALKGGETK